MPHNAAEGRVWLSGPDVVKVWVDVQTILPLDDTTMFMACALDRGCVHVHELCCP